MRVINGPVNCLGVTRPRRCPSEAEMQASCMLAVGYVFEAVGCQVTAVRDLPLQYITLDN
ncbi:MAG TPA: hypothetical protein VF070_47730 [Streptosporangiaceae bacterium]